MNPTVLPSFFTSFLAVLTGIGSLPAVAPKNAPVPVVAVANPESRTSIPELDPPFEGYDARLRDQLMATRQPLGPAAALGATRVLLVGDRPQLPQGRAWLMQNAAAFKKAGVTHLGLESVRANQQAALDAYRDGKLSRPGLLARLLGPRKVSRRYAHRIAIEETVSLVDAANMAGLQVVALGLPEAQEDAAFQQLTGRGKSDLKAAGRSRFQLSLRDIRAPLDRLRSEDMADRIAGLLAAGASRMVVLASPGKLSQYSTAGRLRDLGLSPRTFGFFFPEQDELNASLVKIGRSLRVADAWTYVPLDPEDAGMDALLLAPAALPQPFLR